MILRGAINYGSPVNWASSLNHGLVSWWLALPNWAGGFTLRDLCNRNHGTLTNGPAWTANTRLGAIGSALAFDAADDFVNCGAGGSLLTTLTVSLWMKYSSSNDVHGYPAEHVIDANNSWAVRVLGGGATATVNLKIHSGGSYTRNAVTNGATLNTWEHWALCGSAGGTITIYKNAISQTLAADGDQHFKTAARLDLGGGSFSAATLFGGQLDDVRIFNRILSESEVQKVYEDSLQRYPRTLNRIRLPVVSLAEAAPPGGTVYDPTGGQLNDPLFGGPVAA